MGARTADMPRYGAGHPSISDDGLGNILIADGKQIRGRGYSTVLPFLAHRDALTNGLLLTPTSAALVSSGVAGVDLTATGLNLNRDTYVADVEMVHVPSATQVLLASADTIDAVGKVLIRIDSNGASRSYGQITSGHDGQIITIENVGAFIATLDETGGATKRFFVNGASVTLNVTEAMRFCYSTLLGGWRQMTWDMATV